jgi:ribokinase
VPVRVAVVGHVEWVEFVRVGSVPVAGDIVHGTSELAVAAGGGAVAAVQLARWAGHCIFYTALGDDELGHRAADELRARNVDVRAVFRPAPQRRAVTLIDGARERTIIVIGERHIPHGDDPLRWADLAACDGVYLTGGDAAALRHARRARVVVATSRILPLLRSAAIPLDALVGSATDPSERYAAGDLAVEPALVVRTEGSRGGHYVVASTTHRYAPVPATVTGDTYGAGDTFAAGLTFALANNLPPADAVAEAAARAVSVLSCVGPYGS